MYDLNSIISPNKDKIQSVLEDLTSGEKRNIDDFLKQIDHSSNDPAWQRYASAFAGFPKTWWIAIFQMQMIGGLWGEEHRSAAIVRQNALQAIFNEILSDPEAYEKLKVVARYIWNHRRADLSGRLSGGAFTNFGLTGGRAGMKVLPMKFKITSAVTNFTIGCYGGAIWAVGSGVRDLGDVFKSIILGRPSRLPIKDGRIAPDNPLSDDEAKVFNGAWAEIHAMMPLNKFQSAPIPISVFCNDPKNIDLKMCKPK